jgi:hypothetical protein
MPTDNKYLLTSKEAKERYGISIRQLEQLYRRNKDFPIVRIGHSVMIHRERADAFFDEYIGGCIEVN